MSKEKNDLFQAQAQITKLETMHDGGIRLVVDTQEITDPDELTKLFRIKKGALGWFLFKSNEIKQDDVNLDELPAVELEEGEQRTPSQRLRAVLFVYWKEVKGGKGDFNAFYRAIVESLIEHYKSALPSRSEE